MLNMVTVVDNNDLTRNKDKHNVMDVLINQVEKILSQCIHIKIITLYTLNILHVINCTPVKLKTVQLSHPYMATGKTIALTRWTFVCKVISRLLTTFNPRSKRLLISWLQSPSGDHYP